MLAKITMTLFLMMYCWGSGGVSSFSLVKSEASPEVIAITDSVAIAEIETLIRESEWERVVSECRNRLQQSHSEKLSTHLRVLLDKELNQAEHYEKAQRESGILFKQHLHQLEQSKTLLREAYYQWAYTASGLHNQKYEIAYTQKALEIMEENPSLFSVDSFIQIYNDLYYYQINYEDIKGMQATYRKYLDFFTRNRTSLAGEVYGYARRVLRKMEVIEALNQNQPQQAIAIVNKFQHEVEKILNTDDIAYLNSCYSSINTHYYFAEDYQQAIAFAERYLSFARQTGSQFDVMLAYSKIGISYERLRDYEQGVYYINLSMRAFPFGEFSASLFALQIIKAKCLSGLKRYDEAAELTEQTIEQILSHKLEKKTKILDFDIEEIKALHSHNYINIFATAGLVFLDKYKFDRTKDDLDKAEKVLKTSSTMFREFYLKGEYNSTVYRLHSKNTEGLLYIATEKYKENPKERVTILNLVEENSSKHLYRNYQKKAGIVGDSNGRHQIDVDNLSDLIAQIQQKIDKDEQLLKYYVLPEDIYMASITNTSVSLRRIAKTDTLQQDLMRYLQVIKEIKPDHKKWGKRIAGVLLPNDCKQKITVISDNFLNYLPFETLPEPKYGGFMLERHDFSYAYSLAILLWNRQAQQPITGRGAVIFNPDYLSGATYQGIATPALPYSQKEAKEIRRLLSADIMERQVGKQDFLDRMDEYGLYHFAMHAYLDEDDFNKSCLLFSQNDPLFFEELYQTHIPAEMVVLGACNTGNGKLKSGEGIMSLSLAFSFAGTRSSVYSLWEVPDAETAEILGYFYKNLKKGFAKDEALARAKNEFIRVNPMKSHPFFWAGFIVNGDVSPLFARQSYMGWIIWSLVVMGLLWAGFRIFKPSRPQKP